MSTTERLAQLGDRFNLYAEAAPEVIGALNQLGGAALSNEGALDAKTKELIGVSVAIARQCEPCILAHLDALIKLGMTREELVEASSVAILFCGGPGWTFSSFALDSYDKLVKGE